MEFRSYLADALADTLEADVPFVYNVVRAAHGRYPPNVYGQPEYEVGDGLGRRVLLAL